MKVLLFYWVWGCVMVGISAGGYLNRCPKDDVALRDLVIAVAIWPAIGVAQMTLKVSLPKSECKIG